jgi:hypothetical protein
MMNFVRILLVIFAGALSVGFTEVFSGVILAMAPLDLDLTASFFTSVAPAAVLLVHLLMSLVFWKAFEPNPVRNPLIFIASHASFQAAELIAFNNPLSDVAAYVIIIALSGLLVTWVFRHYFWCAACARIDN